MIGLMYLLFFSAYALISLAVVVGAVKWARKRGRSTFRWGFAAAFIMYNLVFWDWIPSIIQHEYYCRTKAGFWVYKTLEQWKAENPGYLESLVKKDLIDSMNGRDYVKEIYKKGVEVKIISLHPRFESVSYYIKKNICGIDAGVNLIRRDIVDSENNYVLARYVGSSVGSGVGGLKYWKIRKCLCDVENDHEFWSYYRGLKGDIP